MTAPGYWTSTWPGEDAGPARTGVPWGVDRLGVADGGTLRCHAVEAMGAVMAIVREPGELFVLRQPPAGATAIVERRDPETLEVLATSGDLPAGPWWPGGIAAHANGAIYAVVGRWCHRLDPETLMAVASRRLPHHAPYNSFVILPSGQLVMKPSPKAVPLLERPPTSELLLLRADDLSEDAERPWATTEPLVARLAAHGDDVVVLGDRTAWRVGFDPMAGMLQPRYTGTYGGAPEQSFAWDPVCAGGRIWWLDQGENRFMGTMRGAGLGGPVSLWSAAIDGSDQPAAVEICGTAAGAVTNPPIVDEARGLAIGYDSANGVIAAFRFADGQVPAPEPVWRRDVNTCMHLVLYPGSGELVVDDHEVGRGDDLVVLDVATGDELGRVATGSPMQSVVFPAADERGLWYCSFTTLARITVDGP